ncbi:MAG: hypothetical protein ACREUA_02105 [Burkholderiales bacterium]
MSNLVKLVKLNNLQYNPNRDPQVYRRCANQPFRIQALLGGSGQARCRISEADGAIVVDKTLSLPSTFTHELSYATPGARIVTLCIEANGQRYAQALRLDVMEHAWVG